MRESAAVTESVMRRFLISDIRRDVFGENWRKILENGK